MSVREHIKAQLGKIPAMKLHHTITRERIINAVEEANLGLDNPGFCVCCGADASGVEPDARRYECEACGAKGVFGAEELLFSLG